jgi:hypothetical protein
MADYIADKVGDVPTASASCLNRLLASSPRHAWQAHPRLNTLYESDDSAVADIGSAAHEILLGGESRIVVIDAPDWRTKAAKEQREIAYASGLIPILDHKMGNINSMLGVARAFIAASELPEALAPDGRVEHTLVFQHNDVWCRARPDWLSADAKLHISYKTTAGSAEPDAWIRNHLFPEGHDLSAVHYAQGVEACLDVGDVLTVFLVQEQKPPYACSLISLDPESYELACRKYVRALAQWAQCLANDEWPAYGNRICYAEVLPWDRSKMEQREMLDPLQTEHGMQI